MAHPYGTPPGPAGDHIPISRASVPGGLTLTAVSGGSLDVTAAVDTSDSQDTLTVGGVEIMGSATTWATDDDTFGRAITRKINRYAANHNFWATYNATDDKVEIWEKDADAASTSTVTGTATSWTPTYEDMDTYQAYAAAVTAPSANYGADMFADTTMWQVGFDFSRFISLDTDYNMTTAKGVALWLYPQDQIITAYFGPEGGFDCQAAEWTPIDCLAAFEGHQRLFLRAAAATNCNYRLKIY